MSKGEGNANFMNDLVAEMNDFLDQELEKGVEPNPNPEVLARIKNEIAENRARLEGYRSSQNSLDQSVSIAESLGQEKPAKFYDIPSDENAPDKNGAAE